MSLNVELLESSFAKIKDRQAEFTEYFYTNLLNDYPEIKPLFDNIHMSKQQEKLFQSLVLTVDNLRTPDVLTGSLKGLGTRHVKYGVLPEHYAMVGSSLLKTFAFCLQEEWTPNIEQAWIEAYGAITQLMLDGLENWKVES